LFGASTSAGRPGAGDDIGHRVGLAGTGHTEQGLERQTILQPLDQLANGLGLVASGRKGLMQSEGTTFKADNRGAGVGFAHAKILRFFITQQKRCADNISIISWSPYVLFDLCCG
jgi:hypothetical protein